MKNNVTKFDLDAAFKALDEIEIPKVSGLKPRRDDLHESVKRVDRLSMLIEDYYDISDNNDIAEAKEERDDDIARAKLDRIERIVDLDAKSPDDILPSYVGKNIIQCPNCLNLFYKDPSDIEKSEENPDMVNVGEVCQHCGNDAGYNLIGKVADDTPTEAEQPVEETPTEEPTEEIPAEEAPAEDASVEDELPEVPLEEVPEEEKAEEEKKEESFNPYMGTVLNEEVDADLNKKLDEHNEYIKYLQDQIEKEEAAAKTEKNEFVKASIEECIEALKAKLEAAIPEAVKQAEELEPEVAEDQEEEVSQETVEEPAVEEPDGEKEEAVESLTESAKSDLAKFKAGLKEATQEEIEINKDKVDTFINNLDECGDKPLTEDEVSNVEFEKMLDNPLYNEGLEEAVDPEFTSLTDRLIDKIDSIDAKYAPEVEKEQAEVESGVEDEFEPLESEVDEITDESLNTRIEGFLKEVYSNVSSFTADGCNLNNNKLIIEGTIRFNSGKTKPTTFIFEKFKNNKLKGLNEDFSSKKVFIMKYAVDNKSMVVESFRYRFKINKNLVEGIVK